MLVYATVLPNLDLDTKIRFLIFILCFKFQTDLKQKKHVGPVTLLKSLCLKVEASKYNEW